MTARGPIVDPDKIARIIIDAAAMGDVKAAKKHGVSVRTIERYRARMRQDPALADLVGKKTREVERGWAAARTRCMRTLMHRIEELAKTETDLDKLSRAAREVGNIDVASAALSGGNVGASDHPEGAAPAEVAGDGGEGQEPAVH